MKIIFDPIYTGVPSKCASTIKFKRLAEDLLQTPDLFIYWIVPEKMAAEDQDWFPVSENIKYIPRPSDPDRLKEYNRVSPTLERILAYYGDYWDWDICITNRTPQIPTIRAIATHHNKEGAWQKTILAIEDFPLMSFKGYAAIPRTSHQDQYTLLGYQQADETYISAYWEKELILETARAHLAPAVLKKMQAALVECHPYELAPNLRLKAKSEVLDHQPFTLMFAGRLIDGHKFDDIFKVMQATKAREHPKGKKVRLAICTQSKYSKRIDIPFNIELLRLTRDQFHKFLHTASVGVFFSPEEDYSLSLIEPILFGVPYAIYKAPWAIATFGHDYPFYIKNPAQALAVVQAFYDDYPTQYLKFAKWHTNTFTPLIKARDAVTIQKMVAAHVERFHQVVKTQPQTINPNSISAQIANNLTKTPSTLAQILERAGNGAVQHFAIDCKNQDVEPAATTDFAIDCKNAGDPQKAGDPKNAGSTKNASNTKYRNIVEKLKQNQMDVKVSFTTDLYNLRLQLIAKGAVDHLAPGTYSINE